MYLAGRLYRFSNTIARLCRIVQYRNRIVQEENVLHALDIYISSDHKHSIHTYIPLIPVDHFRFLLLDQSVVAVLEYYLSRHGDEERQMIALETYEN